MNSIIYNIDDKFIPDKEFKDIYLTRLKQGKEYAQSQKLLILSTVRNISSHYKYSLRKVKEILGFFSNDSCVSIYENDSIDFTPQLIYEHITKYEGYNNFYVFSERLNTPYLPLSKSKIRTTNLANARNLCYTNGITILPNHDLVLVIDLDFLDFSINGLLNSLGWMSINQEISAICGNSYIERSSKTQQSFHNYDSFAFRINYWDYYENIWFPYFDLPIGSIPIPINSGFGGSCIYKQKFYEPIYDGEDCEHVRLHKKLKEKYNHSFNLYYNPSQIMLLE